MEQGVASRQKPEEDPEVIKAYSECLRRIFKWNMFRKFGPGEKASID